MTTVDWLIWIFFGLPALAIWKCDNVLNAVCVIGLTVLLPYIKYWYAEILIYYGNNSDADEGDKESNKGERL